ncbi:hypothetical protein VYU27_007074, partial [Nannochloropsis oceanica]
MHRALSLLALGITLALTAAQPMLTLTSIKAVDSTSDNKDQWSMKGFLNDPDADFVSTIADEGLFVDLYNDEFDINDDDSDVSVVEFAAADCRDLSNGRGVLCKDAGARISFKKTKRVPHEAKVKAMKNHNKTDSASSYYSVSGVFRRQQFENTIS